MDEAQARKTLGVGAGASPEEVRTAFRSLLRHAHPDVAPDDAEANRATALLVEAYASLRQAGTPGDDISTSPPPAVVEDGDSLLVAGPSNEVYRRLVEAAHGIGEITYLDPDARLLDTIVITDEGVACSLLASLQGRAANTEIFFTVEPLGAEAGPAVEPIVAAIAALLVDPAALD